MSRIVEESGAIMISQNPQRPGLQLAYLILHLDSSPCHEGTGRTVPGSKDLTFSQNPKVGQTNYECARVTLSWIKMFTKNCYKLKGTRGGGGGPASGCGGVTHHHGARPPSSHPSQTWWVRKKESKSYRPKSVYQIYNTKVPWPKLFTKNTKDTKL